MLCHHVEIALGEVRQARVRCPPLKPRVNVDRSLFAVTVIGIAQGVSVVYLYLTFKFIIMEYFTFYG